MNEFISCGKCDSQGYIVENGIAKQCTCKKEYLETLQMKIKLVESNLIYEETSYSEIKRLLDYDLSQYKGKLSLQNVNRVQKYLDNFETRYNSLSFYFYGKQGTQKTTIAKYILTELLRRNYITYYIHAKELIDIIMASDRDDEKKALLDKILRVDCLCLDEWEASKLGLYQSGYKQAMLTSPLKIRLENIRKTTIFISNSSIDEMRKSQLGDTLGDLVERETQYGYFEFNDYYGDYREKLDLSSIWDD